MIKIQRKPVDCKKTVNECKEIELEEILTANSYSQKTIDAVFKELWKKKLRDYNVYDKIKDIS